MKTATLNSLYADYDKKKVTYDEHAPMRLNLGEYLVTVTSEEHVGPYAPGARFEVPVRYLVSPD